MKSVPVFLAMFAFLLAGTHAISSPLQAQPDILRNQPLDITPAACSGTGKFNLCDEKDCLMMEMQCEDGRTRTLRAPRLSKQPNIFRIPFELAVVSIVGEEDGGFVLHLHYYKDKEDETQYVVRLPPHENDEYRYSFAHTVPDPVKPRPVVPAK